VGKMQSIKWFHHPSLSSLSWSVAKKIFIEFGSNKRQVVSQSVGAVEKQSHFQGKFIAPMSDRETHQVRVRQAGNYAIRCLISFFPCLVSVLLAKRAVQINKQFPTTT